MKASGNVKFSDVFRGFRKRNTGLKFVKKDLLHLNDKEAKKSNLVDIATLTFTKDLTSCLLMYTRRLK